MSDNMHDTLYDIVQQYRKMQKCNGYRELDWQGNDAGVWVGVYLEGPIVNAEKSLAENA